MRFVRFFETLTLDDVPLVGGKNASFGELIQALTPAGVRVPAGFALTADAYRALLDEKGVRQALDDALAKLDIADVDSLRETGARCRRILREAPLPPALVAELEQAYAEL